MVWGVELWDTYNPNLYQFLKYNTDFLDTYRKFLTQRSKIEETYSKDLKKLAKDMKCKSYSKQDSSIVFSVQRVFDSMLDELSSYSNQHEAIRDSLLASEKNVKAYVKSLKKERETVEQCLANAKKEVEKRYAVLENCKRKYHSAFLDYKKSFEDYDRIKEDRNLSRAELDRYKEVLESRQMQYEEQQKTYAKSVTDYNACQAEFLHHQLPSQLSVLENIERKFSDDTSKFFLGVIGEDENSLIIQQKCIQSMKNVCQEINADSDIQLFLTATQSGNNPPPDCEFETYSLDPTRSSSDTSLNTTGTKKSKSGGLFGTLRGGKSSEGPAQQKRRLKTEIQEKEKECQKLQSKYDALKKMENCPPGSGFNIKEIQAEMNNILNQVNAQESELRELKNRLASLNGGQEPSGTVNHDRSSRPSVIPATNSTPPPVSAAFADEFDDSPVAPQPPPVPPPAASASVPTAVVLYEFSDDSQADNLSVAENERIQVIKVEADGWTLARKLNSNHEGYVPTSFLEMM